MDRSTALPTCAFGTAERPRLYAHAFSRGLPPASAAALAPARRAVAAHQADSFVAAAPTQVQQACPLWVPGSGCVAPAFTYLSLTSVPAAEQTAMLAHTPPPPYPCRAAGRCTNTASQAGAPQRAAAVAMPTSAKARRILPSPALLTDVQRLQQQFGQAGPREQKLLPRIEAVLASWQGVGGKEIKERFDVNHDTLWRTKVLLRDGGVQGFLAANKRLRICKPKGL